MDGLNTDDIAAADSLARQLVREFWRSFPREGSRGYYESPHTYVIGDTWATSADWVQAAGACVRTNTNWFEAHEILLSEGRSEYLPNVISMLEEWDGQGGFDSDGFAGLIAFLEPGHPLREAYLGDLDALVDVSEWHEWHYERSALIAVGDHALCRRLGSAISDLMHGDRIDEEQVERIVVPSMVALGGKCETYVDVAAIAKVKRLLLEMLERDKSLSPRPSEWVRRVMKSDDATRIVWVQSDLALWAWCLGWEDVLEHLRSEEWYWGDLFEWYCDPGNENLLVWSLLDNRGPLARRAIQVMREGEARSLDGAIAWLRMRARGVTVGGDSA